MYHKTGYNIQLIKGSTMIPLPLLAQIFNGAVTVDEGGAVRVTLGEQVLAAANYDPAQIDLFSRLIFSESGNQSMLGQIAVGNVVINRMNSPLFPSTLYDVIHQKNQFSVVGDGNIYLTRDDEAVIAAKLCLEGAKVTDALFFNVKGLKCWAFYARPFIATIGDHDFYA
jgi:N-acetylmuramoyl-L-alanine amidase